MYDLRPMPIPSETSRRGAGHSPRGRRPGADAAEERARAYTLLANAWRYPDESLIQLLRSSTFDDRRGQPFFSIIDLRFSLFDLQASYARLFGHSVRGICPPYELEYGRSEIIQQTAELADLAGFYHAFGMCMNASARERPDHLAVECEFLSVLCAKEAWGYEQGDSDLAETCADAERLFLRDHLGRWLPAFAHRVRKAEPGGFYARLAEFAASLINDECRRLDIEAGPTWLELRPVDPARDSAIDCEGAGCSAGPADQLVQLGTGSLSHNGRNP